MYQNIRVLLRVLLSLPSHKLYRRTGLHWPEAPEDVLAWTVRSRLSGLGIMHLYSDIPVDVDQVITMFSRRHKPGSVWQIS